MTQKISKSAENVIARLKAKFDPATLSRIIGRIKPSVGGAPSSNTDNSSVPLTSPIKPPETTSRIQNAEYTTLGEGGVSRLTRGDGASNVVAKTINFLIKAHAQKVEQRELEADFDKEGHAKEIREYSKVIDDVKKNEDNEKSRTWRKRDERHTESKSITQHILDFIRKNAAAAGVAIGAVVNTYENHFTGNKSIIDKITKVESNSDYNQMNIAPASKNNRILAGVIDDTTDKVFSKNLTEMTMGEVYDLSMRRGEKFATKDKNGKLVKSAGKASGINQFMPGTLEMYAKRRFGANWKNELYDEKNQDLLGQDYNAELLTNLNSANVPATEQVVRLGHILGVGSADRLKKFFDATPNTSMAEVMGQSAAGSNKELAKMSVGDYKKKLEREGFSNRLITEVESKPIVPQEEIVQQNTTAVVDSTTTVNNVLNTRRVIVNSEEPKSDRPKIIDPKKSR
jgi:hypothetical protein